MARIHIFIKGFVDLDKNANTRRVHPADGTREKDARVAPILYWGCIILLTSPVWPETCYSDDKMQSYLNAVYFIQFCALEYYANASNQTIAEEWRSKGMGQWGNVLDMVGCEYKRDATDWLYLVSRATIDGKQDRDSKRKVTKASTQKAFRKRVEMLVGMALHGFVFVNTMDSVESYKEGRKAKAEKAAAKAAKVAEKAAKAAEKTANEPAPPIMGGIEKPAAKKQTKAKTATKKAKAAPVVASPDNLPVVDNLFNGLEIPDIETLAGVAI